MRRLKNKNLKVNSLPLNKTENNDAKDKNSVIKGSVKFILCNETMPNDRKTPTPSHHCWVMSEMGMQG